MFLIFKIRLVKIKNAGIARILKFMNQIILIKIFSNNRGGILNYLSDFEFEF